MTAVSPRRQGRPVGGDGRPDDGSSARRASLTTLALAVALPIAFFPIAFDQFAFYDDEGVFLMSLREFLHHGSLYVHTGSTYGPFYFSSLGLLYRITGQEPTLFNGRIIALLLTTGASAFFALAVHRVSGSRLFAALCQVASFCLLALVLGNEPLHAGQLLVLLLSVLAYALASYVMQPRPWLMVVAGAAIGAMAMCKINVGVLAAAGLVMAWIVGNDRFPIGWQVVVGVAAAATPFVLAFQRLYDLPSFEFVALVAFTVLAVGAALRADRVSLPPDALLKALAGAVGAVVASILWPLFNGTGLGDLVHGVLLTPLQQVNHLTTPANVNLGWIAFVLTVIGACAALARRDPDRGAEPVLFGNRFVPHIALALAGLWVFGLAFGSNFAAWLPAIALLPALAWLAAAPAITRLALRLFVPLAVLQVLHAYPVAGAQRRWGTVLMFVPCAIALTAGLRRLRVWRRAGALPRTLAVAILAAVAALSLGQWPGTFWHDYADNTALNLPGARLVRVPDATARDLQGLTRAIKRNCDTFYSAPVLDSLYIFTGIAPPTGLLRNWPGAHPESEQREIAQRLSAAQAAGKRVCIVRDVPRAGEWLRSSYGRGPLGAALAQYQLHVARVGRYSVSRKGRSAPFLPRRGAAGA